MDRDVQVDIQLSSPGKLFTPGVTIIMVLSVFGFAGSLYADEFVMKWLALSSDQLFRGMIWQLVTYPFVFCNPFFMLLDLAVILVIGSSIEYQWQTKTFMIFWLFVSVINGLIWALVGILFEQAPLGITSAACCYAMIAVFGLIFQGRRFLLMMTTVDARVLALIMLGVSLLLNLMAPINFIWMLGAGFGYIFVKLREKNLYHQARSSGDTRYQPSRFVDVD